MKLARALCEDLLRSVQQEYQVEYAKIMPQPSTPYYGNPYMQMQAAAYGYYNQTTGCNTLRDTLMLRPGTILSAA